MKAPRILFLICINMPWQFNEIYIIANELNVTVNDEFEIASCTFRIVE